MGFFKIKVILIFLIFLATARSHCKVSDFCCYSVVHFCPTLYDPMDCSTPGSHVLQCLLGLLKFTSIESMMPSTHLFLCSSLLFLPLSFPASGSFPVSWLFASGGIGVSASALVLPVNIEGWFPLVLTGLIFLLFKGLSRVSSSTTIWNHQFFGTQPFLWSNSHIYTTIGKP